MPSVTLQAKIYNDSQMRQAQEIPKAKLKGLRVEFKMLGATSRGWVRIDVSGEDETAAVHFLEKEIGLCPASFANVDRHFRAKGRIVELGRSEDAIRLDIGVFEPTIVDAVVPLSVLQAQLCDGRKLASGRLSELFGFCNGLPLHVRVSDVDREKGRLEAALTEEQLARYRSWVGSLLDRLVVIGAFQGEARSAVEKAGFQRDVIDVEELGLLEQAAVCKLGTDAAGLIPRFGRCLPHALFSVFSPRRIRAFFGEDSGLFAWS